MIWSDSGLIFFFFSPASVIVLSVNVEEINCSLPPLCSSVLEAAADVWRLATGGGTLWDPETEGQHIWHWMLVFIWVYCLKRRGSKGKGDYITHSGKLCPRHYVRILTRGPCISNSYNASQLHRVFIQCLPSPGYVYWKPVEALCNVNRTVRPHTVQHWAAGTGAKTQPNTQRLDRCCVSDHRNSCVITLLFFLICLEIICV